MELSERCQKIVHAATALCLAQEEIVKNMAKETHHTEQLGSKFDGAWATTLGLIAALLIIIAGALLTIFLGGAYSLIFGVPLVVIGLLAIVIVEIVVKKKSD